MFDHVHRNWRFQLSLFPKLNTYRIINTEFKVSCWWTMARTYPFLKKPCCTVIKLLCGSNRLTVNMNTTLPRYQRLCILCNLGVVEDLYHFVPESSRYVKLRNELYEVMTYFVVLVII